MERKSLVFTVYTAFFLLVSCLQDMKKRWNLVIPAVLAIGITQCEHVLVRKANI